MQDRAAGFALAACACCAFRRASSEAEAPAPDRAIWCRPEDAQRTPRLALAVQLARVVERCKELHAPKYTPPCWAAGTWANVVLFMAKSKLSAWLGAEPPLLHERLAAPDGGSLSIDFCDDEATRALPEDAPVVMLLHTITGSGASSRWFLRAASARGWRGCVLNRRAAHEPLSTPCFNLMGSVEDTCLQVEAVRQRYPKAFLAMVGISAGSGLLVSYLGSCGARTPVRAGCCLCPAYDIRTAFCGLRQRYPLADTVILKDLKQRFIRDNVDVLKQHDPGAVEQCLAADSVWEFLQRHVPFTGAPDVESYFKVSNPMEHVNGVSVPLLVLNAEDDMVCLRENIREDLIGKLGGAVLVRTARGSHCAYCEGPLGAGSYLCRLSLDFLAAALETGAHAVDLGAKP